MTPIYYYRISKIFLAISIALLFVSIGSVVSVIIVEFPMKLSLTSQGFENFVSYFSFSIKALTATLATFAIWLTLERLSQTERQIEAIMDNNKFNNYSKHQQEFIDYLKETSLFATLNKAEEVSPRVYIAPLYKVYYAENYVDFRPHMKDSVKRDIEVFYRKLDSSKMSTKDCKLESLPIDEIIEMSRIANDNVGELIEPLTENVVFRMKAKYGVAGLTNPPSPLQSMITRFQCLHKIFWTIVFYKNLLAFDGEIRAGGHFHDNYENYTKRLQV
jgi:hypothetical protein